MDVEEFNRKAKEIFENEVIPQIKNAMTADKGDKVLVSNVFLPEFHKHYKPDQWYEGEFIVECHPLSVFKYRVRVNGVISDWKNMKLIEK